MSNFRYLNVNPRSRDTIDCTVRAISLFLEQSWDDTYWGICTIGFLTKDMPSSDRTWIRYLVSKYCKRYTIPNTCPMCYTVKDFCYDFPYGRYLLKVDEHVVAVIDGYYYDTWDSGDEVVSYYWRKE